MYHIFYQMYLHQKNWCFVWWYAKKIVNLRHLTKHIE